MTLSGPLIDCFQVSGPASALQAEQKPPTNNTLLRRSLGLKVSIPRVPQFAKVVDLGDAPTYYAAYPETPEEPIISFCDQDPTGYPLTRRQAEVRRYYYRTMMESSGDWGRSNYLQWHREGNCLCYNQPDSDYSDDWEGSSDSSEFTTVPDSDTLGEEPLANRTFSDRAAALALIDLFSPEVDTPPPSPPVARWRHTRVAGRSNLPRPCVQVARPRAESPRCLTCGSPAQGAVATLLSDPRRLAQAESARPTRGRCSGCGIGLRECTRLAHQIRVFRIVSLSVLAFVVAVGWVVMMWLCLSRYRG
jgi:hypothetical protein